jgi:hypothetical protein
MFDGKAKTNVVLKLLPSSICRMKKQFWCTWWVERVELEAAV